MRGLGLPRTIEKARGAGVLRMFFPVTVACWGIAMLLFLGFPEGSGKDLAAEANRWAAAAFAGGAFLSVLRRSEGGERKFWSLVGCGLLYKLFGDVGLARLGPLDLASWGQILQNVAYGLSYLVLFWALLRLVGATTRKITLVSALDAVSVLVSMGLLVWHFVLGPVVADLVAGSGGWRAVVVALTQPAGDAGLLCLCLVALVAARRPSFAVPLAGAFALFLIADGIYLAESSSFPYRADLWPAFLGSVGVGLLGLAALRSKPEDYVPRLSVGPWGALSLWWGPLSPALQYGILLASGVFRPPLPAYALSGGIVLMLLFAARVLAFSFASRGLLSEGESLARWKERARLSEDLHDTLKQSVYGANLLLCAYREARSKGDPTAESALDRALAASHEASYQVSIPVEEFRVLRQDLSPGPDVLFGRLLEDVERCFGIKPHTSLQGADLIELSPQELAAAYRVAGEALRNAARHSGAKNVWLVSRRTGPITLLEVRDDGRGFHVGPPSTGAGLHLMRARAEGCGGTLRIYSSPKGGTTVRLALGGR